MTAPAVRPIQIGEWLRLSALRFPDRPCLIDEGEGVTHTFAETNERVDRLADALTAHGVRHGDTIAILAVDTHRYLETLLASMKLGTVYVPLNYRLAEPEVQTLVAASGARWIFVSDRYAALARRLCDGDGRPLRVVDYDDDGPDGYEALVAGGRPIDPARRVAPEDLVGLAFTSGTTGLPKGVQQSQRMMKAMVSMMMVDYAVRPEECRYSAAPMFHISGMAMIFMGITRGYPNVLHHQFDPQKVLTWLQEDRLTACFMVPTMISSVVNLPGARDAAYERLQTILYGAAPMPPALLRQAMGTFGCDFIQAFGAGTEAGLQTVLTAEDHRRALAGEEHLLDSIGKPAWGVELRLCDEEWRDVAPGAVGEIVTRSDSVMSGYLRNPDATAQSIHDGWFRAGDLARQDDEGYLYLAGRAKDMIIRGGENVYPIEIESVLAEHPAILEVSVVGAPDEHWGEIVEACPVLRPGHERPSDEELQTLCRRRLASYKVPARFRWMDTLPRNASGKILKRELREPTD